MQPTISIEEIYQKAKNEALTILDVREIDEFAQGHIESAVNIPLSELAARTEELDKTKTHYVICHSGGRSEIACRYLREHDFTVVNVMGGMAFWRGALV